MATANKRFFDANLRRAIDLERLKKQEAGKAILILDAAIPRLEERVRRSLGSVASGRDKRGSKRLIALLVALRKARQEAFQDVNAAMRLDMGQLGRDEVAFQVVAAEASVPVVLDLVTPTAARLRSAIFTVPFQGLKWAQHIKNLEKQDFERIRAAVNLGFIQGESTEQVITRLFGTFAQRRRDGALAVTRRHLDALVKTAFNHVANQAREEMALGNEDIIRALRWTSVLDGRTSPICRGRAGKMDPLPGKKLLPGEKMLKPRGARPPAHFRCRATIIFVLDGIGIVGTRPFVRDIRTRRVREIDFRREAREAAGGRWKSMGAGQRRSAIQAQRNAWADEAIGEAPAAMSYDQWLRTQDAPFQDSVLGKAKGKLFRGGLEMDEFVDFAGKEFTLKQLQGRVPGLFSDVGL